MSGVALHVHRDDRSTRGVERLGQPVDHRDRGVVDVRDMPEVEDHEVGVFETRDDRAMDLLGSGEEQVTLQLVQRDGAATPGDGFVLGDGADTIGDDLVAPHDASDDGLDSRGRAQQVQLQVTRQPLARQHAAHAVAAAVERWREHADGELAGQHGHDAARDAALRGQADVVDPLPRVVVHAARRHHAEHVGHMVGTESRCLPVIGFCPSFASVAPMTARSRAVTRTEHCPK